ncbi:MAG: hypothetical protein ACLVJH_02265 [Faecalibacterium prausnitzii]
MLDILQNFQPISEAKAKPIQITPETGADLSLNDKGEVDLDEGYVIGKAADVFGAKIYESTPALDTALQDLTDAPAPAKEEHLEPLKKSITKEIITPMVEQAKQEYGRDLKLSDQKRFESTAKAKMDVAVNKVVDNYRIDQSQLETQRTQQLQSCTTAQQRQQVNREFDAKQQQSTAALMETCNPPSSRRRRKCSRPSCAPWRPTRRSRRKRATRTPSVTISGAFPAPSRPSSWPTATRL